MNGWAYRLLLAGTCTFVWLIMGPAQLALGQSDLNLVRPAQVLLYLHPGLRNIDFVEPLICALKRVLVAPVDAQRLDLSLGSDLLATPTQLDVAKVADKFFQATATISGPAVFNYFLIPHDMKDGTYRYVFATTYTKGSARVGVVSMARLQIDDASLSRRQRAEVAALRAYKLIIKSIARVAGFPDLRRCVLASPMSLDELDRKSAEFCPMDRAALVNAGILKSEESAGCVYVAERFVPSAEDADKALPSPRRFSAHGINP
jgi:predicted Zn-dependent protease